MTDPKLQQMVEALFARLTLFYGSAFTRMYEGLNWDDVRATWATELKGVPLHLIRAALLPGALPDRCPNPAQFRVLAQSQPRPVETFKPLPAPKVSPEALQRHREALRAIGAALSPKPASTGWALRLRDREMNGDKSLTRYQRDAWRAVLGSGSEASQEVTPS